MTSDFRRLLDEEAREAEERADREEQGTATPSPGQRARRQPSAPSQVYTVRIPVDRLEELRRLAERLGEAPSTLLRKWALERLDEEAGRPSAGESSEQRLASAMVAALLKLASDEGGLVVVGPQEAAAGVAAAGEAPQRCTPRLGSTRRLTSDLSTAGVVGERSSEERRSV
jgi:hypothetical protein